MRLGTHLLSLLVLVLLAAGGARADEPAWVSTKGAGPPAWLPRYELDMQMQLDQHQVIVKQRVTWTNRHERPANEIVFNAHSHYQVPKGDIPLLAKTLEILRIDPSDAIDSGEPPLRIQKAQLGDTGLTKHYQQVDGNLPFQPYGKGPFLRQHGSGGAREEYVPNSTDGTALVVSLPEPVGPGQSVTVDLEFVFNLPQKQGRWGQWNGVTFLATWLPVVAVYDEEGWHPTPFVPWHQPFFNEAGNYTARVTLPADQKVAHSGTAVATDLGNGMKRLDITAPAVRDFALVCSNKFQEWTCNGGPVKVKVLALPEHEPNAKRMLDVVCECIPLYGQWFGAYPYPEFTVVESYFGWNGNECGNVVLIDSRVLGAPSLATGFVEYLVSHEVCHQWWYNVVGTNGYRETWMDEGLAVFFSHKYMDRFRGHNSSMLEYPKGLGWLPNINREDYRWSALSGVIGRGEQTKTIQNMEGFSHLINLLGMTYDKGGRIMGMVQERLGGEAALFAFMRRVYAKYQFRIITVADFQHELEDFTGRSWQEFFDNWLRGQGLTDWAVDSVKVQVVPISEPGVQVVSKLGHRVTVLLSQKAEIFEDTQLGFQFKGSENYTVRLPISPGAGVVEIQDPPARIETLPDKRIRVEVTLPQEPTQIAVDPDEILVDKNQSNNFWKTPIRYRVTPLETVLDESNLTNAHDRWNLNFGPYVNFSTYSNPWYDQSPIAGARVNVHRNEFFNGGVYTGFRTNDRAVVVGADGLWDHYPWSHTQVGFNFEEKLTAIGGDGQDGNHGALFGRYVFMYGDSLYLPPFHYLEGFAAFRNEELPFPDQPVPGTDRFNHQYMAGIHHHINYMTPYWYPEGGYSWDATYAHGFPILGEKDNFDSVSAQFALVKGLPDGLGWLSDTSIALRAYGAGGLPDKGLFFSMGGGNLFRGYDLSKREGNVAWVGSVEWRFPILPRITWDCCDHCLGLRNVYGAAFYDVGDTYVLGHSQGPVAHAAGGGLRFDVAWLSFVERTTIRIDVAKSFDNAPVQVWIGFGLPF